MLEIKRLYYHLLRIFIAIENLIKFIENINDGMLFNYLYSFETSLIILDLLIKLALMKYSCSDYIYSKLIRYHRTKIPSILLQHC